MAGTACSQVRMGFGMCLALAGVFLLQLPTPAHANESHARKEAQVLDFNMKRIDGSSQNLADYRGQVALLVNVASKCGLTPQYSGLEALYEKNRERGFVVLGFPANNFAGQEPGSDEEIAEFCRATYDIKFPMFSKISVKGHDIHPLYAKLTGLPEPIGGEVQWNFQKYLVNRRGEVVEMFSPKVTPEAPELVSRIEALLAEQP